VDWYYVVAARFLAGDPHGLFAYNRPPGYPAFLAAAGLTWLGTLVPAIASQAIMGAAAPLLVYGILRTVSRPAARGAALLYMLSGTPYSFAKTIQAEQAFAFCVLAMMWGLSRFLAARRPLYARLAIFSGTAAFMIRNEAMLLALIAFAVMLVSAGPIRRRLAAVLSPGLIAFALVMAWTVERAAILHDWSLIGSLSNQTGHQMFGQVYVVSLGFLRDWHCVIVPDPKCAPVERAGEWPPYGEGDIVVRPENGPATKHLDDLIWGWAHNSGYQPDEFSVDFFAHPNTGLGPPDKMRLADSEAIERLGYTEGDKLLFRVSLEAVEAHPEILYTFALRAIEFFGFSYGGVVDGFRKHRWMGLNTFNWTFELPRNDTEIAQVVLPQSAWLAYEDEHENPPSQWTSELWSWVQWTRGVVRIIVGLVFLVTWPALFLARDRALPLFLGFSTVYLAGIYSIGAFWQPRYEHVFLPVLIMTTKLALDILSRDIRARRGSGIRRSSIPILRSGNRDLSSSTMS